MPSWSLALTLDSSRNVVAGSDRDLADSIRQGADLRIGTEFIHNEHIDVHSERAERVREVAEFGVTYLVDDRWVAGIMSLRQPVELPNGFGGRPSMSFFLYNQDGTQAIARPHLDGAQPSGVPGSSSPQNPDGMPKYHTHDSFDAETNAPSSNFTYDFDVFKFYVRDSWEEVLSHDAEGDVQSGSVDALAEAFSDGCAVKVGIADLCSNLKDDPSPLQHEVFVEVGSSYYYVDQKLFIAGSHPVVRVKPGIPLRYESQGWDFGWLVLRTDGVVSYRRCDPYTLTFEDDQKACPVRWFVR
jgi:hypothetical protein